MLVCLFVVLIRNLFQELIEDVVGVTIGNYDTVSQTKQISNAAPIDWIFSLTLFFQNEMKVYCRLDDATNGKIVS